MYIQLPLANMQVKKRLNKLGKISLAR